MKATIENLGLTLLRGELPVAATCPFAHGGLGIRPCDLRCPHLDISEPGVIRLTCGGTDVVFETSSIRIGMDTCGEADAAKRHEPDNQ
jgi:hypothetical protein